MNWPPDRRLTRFSLRGLLILCSLVAAYWAGWRSHRVWNQKNLSETMQRAFDEAEAKYPVKIEAFEGTDIFMTRGRREDIDKVNGILEEVGKAATK